MSCIYTRGGDAGQTSLCGGERISKADLRVECYGQLDGLDVALGAARLACETHPQVTSSLEQIQQKLRSVIQVVASRPESPWHQIEIEVAPIEAEIDRFSATLPPLHDFVKIGVNQAEIALHQARVHCRQCERLVVALCAQEPQDRKLAQSVLPWLNRLSDLLFTLSRITAAELPINTMSTPQK